MNAGMNPCEIIDYDDLPPAYDEVSRVNPAEVILQMESNSSNNSCNNKKVAQAAPPDNVQIDVYMSDEKIKLQERLQKLSMLDIAGFARSVVFISAIGYVPGLESEFSGACACT